MPLPSLPEQRAIAHILGALDDKIELNRWMNETLESIARALFKSWFVDFDPVRAKMEGRQPSGLSPDLANLFPDSFQDSGLGEIPKGWRVAPIGEILELSYGKALKAGDRNPGSVPVYGSNGQVGSHDEYLVEGPGIVVGRKGNPGTVEWVNESFFPIDTTFYVTRRDSSPSFYFLFYRLSFENLQSLGADSAVPGLNRNQAYMSRVVVAGGTADAEFTRICAPIFKMMSRGNDESRTLAQLRDTLLPKLLSGELRVKDAEKFVENAV